MEEFKFGIYRPNGNPDGIIHDYLYIMRRGLFKSKLRELPILSRYNSQIRKELFEESIDEVARQLDYLFDSNDVSIQKEINFPSDYLVIRANNYEEAKKKLNDFNFKFNEKLVNFGSYKTFKTILNSNPLYHIK